MMKKMMNSKYDFVKVRVWLQQPSGQNYYVLSRYLISRVLTVIKIPYVKAVKIALELKKYLVDNELFEVSQDQMESQLFLTMAKRGCGDLFIQRYKLMNRFFQQRRPVLILICGAPCTGKSTLAQHLAARLNLPNVLQTDLIYELLRRSADSPLHSFPLWQRTSLSDSAMLGEYKRECCVVRRGLDGEIRKALAEGKPMIFEGLHLDPSLYIAEFAGKGVPITESISSGGGWRRADGEQNQGDHCNMECSQNMNPICLNVKASSQFQASNLEIKANGTEGGMKQWKKKVPEDFMEEREGVMRSDHLVDFQPVKSGPWELEPIFIPVAVTMDQGDHQVIARQWCSDTRREEGLDFNSIFNQVRSLDNYIHKKACEGVTTVSVDLSSPTSALNFLHDHFLDCVEAAMKSSLWTHE